MLQVFCLDVATVDLDVAFTWMLQTYVSSVFMCFVRMFASVSSRCCICLQWFLIVFQSFSQVFQMLVSSVSSVFFSMLQLLHLDVSKVDPVLHIGCAWETADGVGDVRGWRGTTIGALPPCAGSVSLPDRTSGR